MGVGCVKAKSNKNVEQIAENFKSTGLQNNGNTKQNLKQ
jgi:hypothetical protein